MLFDMVGKTRLSTEGMWYCLAPCRSKVHRLDLDKQMWWY
jgi:hypothetical protein